ncbi:MAG: hypothetical protein ACI9FD_005050 [Gammaproteobacteria bacterium]|jgi:uncharacterized protein with NRDE domain
MCFILIGYQSHPDYPLVLAANRDEFLNRPSQSASWWENNILAGKDLEQGGTWLGVNSQGSFAAVTNFRGPQPEGAILSRGDLPVDFLSGQSGPEEFAEHLSHHAQQYRAFNLLLGSSSSLYFCNNHESGQTALSAGIYGLSNASLDTPWPKLRHGKARFAHLMRSDQILSDDLFNLLTDPQMFPDEALPDTGLPVERERELSAMFIQGDTYATRSSTVVMIHKSGQVYFEERNHRGNYSGNSQIVFNFKQASVTGQVM